MALDPSKLDRERKEEGMPVEEDPINETAEDGDDDDLDDDLGDDSDDDDEDDDGDDDSDDEGLNLD